VLFFVVIPIFITKDNMNAEFKVCSKDQQMILDILDDDIFYGYLEQDKLNDLLVLAPENDIDKIIFSVLKRAVNIIISD